jgi:hypothetical protein
VKRAHMLTDSYTTQASRPTHAPVGGEWAVVPQRRVNEPAAAVIQRGSKSLSSSNSPCTPPPNHCACNGTHG